MAAALVAVTMGLGAGTALADKTPVRVRSTTDIVDSGLKDDVILPMYSAANPNDDLQVSSEGTGAAINSAEQGSGDALVTHAPTSEAQFISLGYSLEPLGRQIFFSDYVIVGPKNDPANVATLAPHDAVSAYEAIAAAGEAGKATYVTRNDASGTNVQEQLQWGMTDPAKVTTQTPFNYKAPATPPKGTAVPGSGGKYPAWYVPAGTGTVGQGAGLTFANSCNTTNGGCYTMADRGTFNKYVNGGLVPNLQIVSQHNDATARGGQTLLVNPFSVYIVNPGKFPAGKVDPAAGTRFADFITSPAFQATLASYPTAADPAFTSDAFPIVTGTPPTTAAAGSTVPLSVSLHDALPPQLPIQGIPVQLQVSVDGGQNYGNVGDPVLSAADGTASFSPTVSTTSTYRVTTPRYLKFSPTAAVLGVVSTPTNLPVGPPAAPDKTPATVSKVALTGRTLAITIDEKSTIDVVIARKTTKTTKVKGKKKTKTTYPTVKKLSLSAPSRGIVKTKFTNLKPATYRITITTFDAAGNTKRQVVSLVLKAKKTVAKTLR